MPTVADLVDDLAAEHDDLDRVVAALGPDDWNAPTPSHGWTIADQIGHLAYFDRVAALAITDREAFEATKQAIMARDDLDHATLAEPRALSPAGLLAWWREGRRQLVAAASSLDEGARVPWYGPPMSAKSFLTARLMETWAHGQDVCDTLGVTREPSDRLRHIAQLGVITRGWSYVVRGRQAPDTEVYVGLDAPSGGRWEWGDPGAPSRVTGPALDFCQVVTQRRHVADTHLVVDGEAAAEWMELAQAFAGAPTSGPPAGAFA